MQKCLKAKQLIAACLLCLTFGVAAAQNIQTNIIGDVKDTQGALVENAKVRVQNTSTNVQRTVMTKRDGSYLVPSLVVGIYDVTAEAPGFKTVVKRGVEVQANNSVRADLVLPTGEVSETVQVNASESGTLLRTEDPATGIIVPEKLQNQLPLKNRNFVSLAQLAPGANAAANGNQNDLGRTQSQNLSVNGQRMFDNNYLIDGVSIIMGFDNGSTYVPSLAAIQQVSVQTGLYGAAQGFYSGAQVDMSTKSGTNRLHGSIYEYLRNNIFNAKQFFDVAAPPPYRFNQFGLAVGGPVWLPKLYDGRNRTFFFFAYEGDRIRQQNTGTGTVPTQAMRDGHFAGLTTLKNPLTGKPYPNNDISALIAPQAKALLQFIPLPDLPGNGIKGTNYTTTYATNQDDDQFIGRLDHKLTSKDSLFFRALHRSATFDYQTVNKYFQSFGKPQSDNYVLASTHLFTRSIYNEARVYYDRENIPTVNGREATGIDPQKDFGISGLDFSNPLVQGIPNAAIAGYIGTGEANTNPRLLYSAPGFSDHLLVQRGKHDLNFGMEFYRARQDFFSVSSVNQGNFSFTGQLSNNAFADFLLGFPFSTRRRVSLLRTGIHQKHLAAYVQDNWRVSDRLTLNLGLRYEFAGSFYDVMGMARELDPKTLALYPAVGSTASLTDPRNQFDPRLGFSYRMRGGTVVRGGFGIYSTQPTVANVTLTANNPPGTGDQQYFTTVASPNLTLANGFQTASAGAAVPPDLQIVPRNYGPGYSEAWTLNLQKQLGEKWVAEAGYVGSHTLHLDTSWTDNTPAPGPGDVQSRRPIKTYGAIRTYSTDAVSYYDGLQTRIQNANFHGVNLLATYTYSKCMDTHSSAATSVSGTENQEPQNEYDRFSGERGRCVIDFPHQVHLSAVYEIPLGSGLTGIRSLALRGWQVSGNLTLQSGGALTPILAGNTANTGRGTIRPDRNGDPNAGYSTDSRYRQWFNTKVFSAPAAYTFGNAGRGIIRGPGTDVLDLSAGKTFHLPRETALQFRTDAFNLLNHPNWQAPNLTFGTPTFGQVTKTQPARNLQFSLTLLF